MTQLTLNQRSALARRQQQRGFTPESSSESDDDDLMARVRRNSLGGRGGRHESMQSDPRRTIRPKGHSTEVGSVPMNQPTSSTPNTWNQSVQFRGIRPPPQLVTSRRNQDGNVHLEAQQLQSPERSSLAFNEYEYTSHFTDVNDCLSPLDYTPSQSASSERAGSQAGFSALLSTSRKRSDSASTGFLDRTLQHGKPTSFRSLYGANIPSGVAEPLAGIDSICDGEVGDWPPSRMHEPTPPSSMMLPSALSHVRDLDEPWSPLEVEEGFASSPSPISRPQSSSVQRASEAAPPTLIRMSSRGGGRAGRRQGPLSSESRQNANDVRKERSCLRCFVYKETCDTSKDVCQNCSNKQARTWKLGCVRPRLMFRTHYLLPGTPCS